MCVKRTKKKSKTVCMSSLFLCNQQAKNEVPLSLLNTFLLLFNEKNKTKEISLRPNSSIKQNFFSFSFLILENKNDKKKFLTISCKTMRLHYTWIPSLLFLHKNCKHKPPKKQTNLLSIYCAHTTPIWRNILL